MASFGLPFHHQSSAFQGTRPVGALPEGLTTRHTAPRVRTSTKAKEQSVQAADTFPAFAIGSRVRVTYSDRELAKCGNLTADGEGVIVSSGHGFFHVRLENGYEIRKRRTQLESLDEAPAFTSTKSVAILHGKRTRPTKRNHKEMANTPRSGPRPSKRIRAEPLSEEEEEEGYEYGSPESHRRLQQLYTAVCYHLQEGLHASSMDMDTDEHQVDIQVNLKADTSQPSVGFAQPFSPGGQLQRVTPAANLNGRFVATPVFGSVDHTNTLMALRTPTPPGSILSSGDEGNF